MGFCWTGAPPVALIEIEIAFTQRYNSRLVAKLVAQIQAQKCRQYKIATNKIEPRKHRSLKHSDVCAEQNDHKQYDCEPRTIRIEFEPELQVCKASALRDPRLAKP